MRPTRSSSSFCCKAGIGAHAFDLLTPIALVVCVLLVIVVMSYRQTIHAYPSGGGAYIVSRENLGEIPSLVAGSSLLVDYILTVAVSVAGGVLAIRTATGFDNKWTVPICLACIVLMTVVNLRGVKESGAAFAGPTYFYVVMLLVCSARASTACSSNTSGRSPTRCCPTMPSRHRRAPRPSACTCWRGRSRPAPSPFRCRSGLQRCSAFRKPESKNAATTLVWMGVILGSCFLGVSVLASHLEPYRGPDDGNGLGLMAEYIFGGKGTLFWMLMVGTFLILILAANTAYADFPRLASIIARDGFLPRQFFNRGARLVFSNGVIFLASVAGVLIIVFDGDISALIPLYAFGVFTGFTLSQAGMVRHHIKQKQPNWRVGMVINAIGAVSTGLIATVVVVSKFTEGAWIPAALIPIMVFAFRSIASTTRAAEARSSHLPATGHRRRPTRWWCWSAESTKACCAPCSTRSR
jgi:amino acid transporter